MKYLIASLAAVMFLAVASPAQSKNEGDDCQGLNEAGAALVREYRGLRDKRRQLPQGTYDKDLQAYDGRLHRVLTALGVELGHPPYTKRKIVRCLGEPDAVRNSRRMNGFLGIYNRELQKAGRKTQGRSNREYLIYFWRGWHDFIFFITDEDDVIVDHGWWFAYE